MKSCLIPYAPMCLEPIFRLAKIKIACTSVHGSEIGSLCKALHTHRHTYGTHGQYGDYSQNFVCFVIQPVFYHNSSTFLVAGIWVFCAAWPFDFDHRPVRSVTERPIESPWPVPLQRKGARLTPAQLVHIDFNLEVVVKYTMIYHG